jgi:hypothetical protein
MHALKEIDRAVLHDEYRDGFVAAITAIVGEI